jgi:hypothetical protein
MYQKGWYQCQHKWVRMKDCIELRRKIPLLKGFIDEQNKKFRSELTEKENNLRDAEEDEQDEDLIKELKKSIEGIETKRVHLANAKRKLDKTSFKNNIITECRDLFIGTIDIINEINHDTEDTEDTEDLITPGCQLTQSPIILFVKHLVTKDKEYEKEDVILLTSKELLTKFDRFIENNNIIYKTNTISFGMLLKNSNINGIETGIHTRTCKKTRFVKEDIKNHMCL